MCELKNEPLSISSFTGYKIVWRPKGDDNYYSVAMGVKYPKTLRGKIPTPKIQHSIGGFYVDNLLEASSIFHQPLLTGKTAVFQSREDAQEEFRRIRSCFSYKKFATISECLLMRVIIKNNLLAGRYRMRGEEVNIIAGKRIKFIETIDTFDF